MPFVSKIQLLADYYLPEKEIALQIGFYLCVSIAVTWLVYVFKPDSGEEWHRADATIRRCSLDPTIHAGRLETNRRVFINLVVSYPYERYPYASQVTVPDATGMISFDRFKVDSPIVVRVNPESPKHVTFYWEDQKWVTPKRSTESLQSPQPPHRQSKENSAGRLR